MNIKLIKLRQDYVRLTKQRAIRRIDKIIRENGVFYFNYSYSTLRQIYDLIEYTITNSEWSGHMFTIAYRLKLLYDHELDITKNEISKDKMIFLKDILNYDLWSN